MTDNEIMNALECCTNPNGNDCYQCPKWVQNYDTTTECGIDLMADTLKLITRQKAEIERLQKHNTEMARKHYQDGRAEAIKEFAERLKNEIISDTAYGCDTNQHSGYYDYQIKIGDIPEYIDNLVKEMVGDV